MLANRLTHYKKLEDLRGSKLLVYVTSDRRNLETKIASEILFYFGNHLDAIGDVEKISLYLYTRGGETLAAWSLVNLVRSFCKQFEVIVPSKAHSAGTLICLGANPVVMTKQASLGPIDPSTNGIMNPEVEVNGQKLRVPVSVEHVNGFLEMVKTDLGIHDQQHLKDIVIQLAEKIHPLSLGDVFRSKSQIQMLAQKLLRHQQLDPEKTQKVINFLCSESGSHDYAIYRKEATEELGLKIEKPNDELYAVISEIQKDITQELELNSPYDPKILLATAPSHTYSFRRALIESIAGGCDVFTSSGTLSKTAVAQGQVQKTSIQDNRTFEGWKHETVVPPTP